MIGAITKWFVSLFMLSRPRQPKRTHEKWAVLTEDEMELFAQGTLTASIL